MVDNTFLKKLYSYLTLKSSNIGINYKISL
jgi:hypothetical protein